MTAYPSNARPRLPGAFWALVTSQFVYRIGGFVSPFLVPYLTRERQLTMTAAGAVAAAVGVGTIGSQLLGGWLSDRIGRRQTMLAGFLGTALGLAALGCADTPPTIWAAALGVGLVSDLFRPAGSATVADLLGPDDRIRAFGLLFCATNLGFSIAAASGGVLIRYGYGLLFSLNAAASVLAAVIIWRRVPDARPSTPKTTGRALLPVLLRDRPMITMSLIMTAYSSLYLQVFSTLPLVMAGDGLGPATYGAVLAANGLVIVAAQPLAVRLLGGRDRSTVLGVSMLFVGLGLGLHVVVHTTAGYFVAMLVWTAGEIGLAVMFGATFADLAPAELRGGYLGVAAATFGVGGVLGPLLGTALLDHIGPTALWTACAATGVALFAAQHAVAPALRHRTTSDERSIRTDEPATSSLT
ncbi:MAG: MDR family MFS transporter [Labedaea sp.]